MTGKAVRYQLDQRQIERTYCAGEWLKLPETGCALNIRWTKPPTGVPKNGDGFKTPDGRFASSALPVRWR